MVPEPDTRRDTPSPAARVAKVNNPPGRPAHRAESTSSNSTSSSRGNEQLELQTGFTSKPKIALDAPVELESSTSSLQAAFAARRRLAQQSKSPKQVEEDNPFVSRPKVCNDDEVITPEPVRVVAQSKKSTPERIRSTAKSSPPVNRRSIPEPTHVSDFDELPAVAGANHPQPILDDRPKPLRECCYCERKFSVDVINKHEGICGKQKARPTFDSKNHRLAGIDPSGNTLKKVSNQRPAPTEQPIKVKKATWKDKSDQLRAAIGAARTTDPMEKRKYEEDLARVNQAALTKCEYCGRSFNGEAAQRHIPICKSKSLMMPRTLPGRVALGGTGVSVPLSKVTKLPPIQPVHSGVAQPRLHQPVGWRAPSQPHRPTPAVTISPPSQYRTVRSSAVGGYSAASKMRF